MKKRKWMSMILVCALALQTSPTSFVRASETYHDVKNEADGTYETPVNVNGEMKYTYLSEDDFKTLTEIYNIIIQ